MKFHYHVDVKGTDFGRILASILVFTLAVICAGQTPRSATDEQVRPVLIYQIAQYVNWPESYLKSGSALRFCVLDDVDLTEALNEVVRAKSIQGRRIVVTGIKGPAEMTGCHVAFLGAFKPRHLREFLIHWAFPPVLLVGEMEGFARFGGMVNLKVTGGKAGIEINLESTERAGLKMRSQLLQLAQIVSGGGVKK